MSFSKAKLQRFNELGSEAPPPGAYDPKYDNKIKGLVIEKSDRFLDTKSSSSAECVSLTSGKNTTTWTSSFRAPQIPRKRMVTKSAEPASPKSKNGYTSLVRSQSMKYEFNQQLADLRVECLNKDKTIQEHEKHIEEMKDEVRKLEVELKELCKKQNEIEIQHMKDIETMTTLQKEVINNRDNKHQAEMQLLRSQLLEVTEEKGREISTRKAIEMELRNRVAELSKRITVLEAELCVKKEEHKTKMETLETRIEELQNALKTVTHDRNTEIGLLQKEKCQLDVCVADLTQERFDLESKLELRQNVILELQAQLSALQCELDELKVEYEKLADDSIKRISDLTDKHEKEVEHLKDNFLEEKEKLLIENEIYKTHESEMEAKTSEIEETNSFLMEELKDLQRLYKDVCQRLQEAQEELEFSNKKHIVIVEKYKQDLNDMNNVHVEEKLKLEQLLENTKIDYLKELENVTIAKNKELVEVKEASTRKIEKETKRVMEHAQKMIENAEANTRETLAAWRTENEKQVNAMTRNTVEEEIRQGTETYKMRIARMEMERAALDEELSQRDGEITKLSATLEELRSSVETQESFSQSLQTELDKAETELAEKKEELRALKDHIRTEAAEMVARKRRFEVIINENQASIVALTSRLAQSNAEVDRLQAELKCVEDSMIEHRDMLNMMHNKSRLVYDQVQAIIKELDTRKELVDQCQIDDLSQLESIKSIFEVKIEKLKQEAAEKVTRLQSDFEQTSLQNDELKKQLDKMAKSLHDAENLLLKLEERNDFQELDITRMELANDKLFDQLRCQEIALERNNQLLQDQTTQHKIAIDEANSRIEELSDKAKRLEEREKNEEEIALLLKEERIKWKNLESELIQQLEEEKTRRKEAEEEVKTITALNNQIKKDYEEISEKYAEVIGHQNPKQRIKHVSQLKDKNYHLEQELRTKTKLVEQQQKTIEKLKAEEKRSQWKGKENVGMVHSTPISSPHKTLTPLRSRND